MILKKLKSNKNVISPCILIAALTSCSGETIDTIDTNIIDNSNTIDSASGNNDKANTTLPNDNSTINTNTNTNNSNQPNRNRPNSNGNNTPTNPIGTPPSDPTDPDDQEVSFFTAYTDSSCSDGEYYEELPDLTANIDSIIQSVDRKQSPSTDDMAKAQLEVYDLAFPYGAYILRESPGFDGQYDCAMEWSDPSDYGPEIVWQLAIHECGHALSRNKFYISENYTIDQPSRDYFPREELTKDRFHNDVPSAPANDLYFDVGSVTGDQGIQTMYDEWSQYIHSVAADYLLYRFPDLRYTYDISLMLNFAWAAPRYLLWAKENRPTDYDRMINDEDVREATLVLWGQTWFYYDAFLNDHQWNPDKETQQLMKAIKNKELQLMMDEVRIAHGCRGTL